jgi:hypothetical protein
MALRVTVNIKICIQDIVAMNISQFAVEVVIQLHYGCLVAASIAIIGRAENRYQVLIVRPAEPLRHISAVTIP